MNFGEKLAVRSVIRIALSLLVLAAHRRRRQVQTTSFTAHRRQSLLVLLLVLVVFDWIDARGMGLDATDAAIFGVPRASPTEVQLYQRVDKAVDTFVSWVVLAALCAELRPRQTLLRVVLGARTVAVAAFLHGQVSARIFVAVPNFFDVFAALTILEAPNAAFWAVSIVKVLQEIWLHS